MWNYERATWPYDLLVALIIATVFLAPGSFFGELDRPRKFLSNARQQQAARQANAGLSGASRATLQPVSTQEPLEVSKEKLSAFLQKQGRADELKNNPHAALVLYAGKELNREITNYEIRFDAFGQPQIYRMWLK